MQSKMVLVRSKNFVERQLGEETVLVPITQLGIDVQNIYTLNTTAALVWNLLEKVCTERDIINIIEKEYTADSGVITQDVKSILAEFIQESIVEVLKE